MEDGGWLRIGGLAGIAFVALNLVGAFLPGSPPKPDAPIADIRSFYVDHRAALIVGAYLSGLAAFAGLWFVGTLREALRRAEHGGPLGGIVFAGGVATSVLALAGTIMLAVAAMDPHRDDASLRLLADLGNVSFAVLFFPWALFNVAGGIALLRTGLFARWIGWSGIAVGVVFLVAAGGLGTRSGAFAAGGAVSFIALVLGMAWGLVISVAMLRVRLEPVERLAPVAV
jgi:hypothetical protein